jgi:predicted enzyme related to lactoylglutathione lyase
VLQKVDAVTVAVSSLDDGIAFYGGVLGQALRWRNDEVGQAGMGMAGSDTEIVLTTRHGYEPNWLVESVDDAVTVFEAAGCAVLSPPSDIPVGRLAVVKDPFGNVLVIVDLSRGRYTVVDDGTVTGVRESGT